MIQIDCAQQLQQQQQQQMFHPPMQHPSISAGFRIPPGPLLPGQAPSLQQNKFSQMLPNNLPSILPQHHQVSALLSQQQPQMMNNNKPPGMTLSKSMDLWVINNIRLRIHNSQVVQLSKVAVCQHNFHRTRLNFNKFNGKCPNRIYHHQTISK